MPNKQFLEKLQGLKKMAYLLKKLWIMRKVMEMHITMRITKESTMHQIANMIKCYNKLEYMEPDFILNLRIQVNHLPLTPKIKTKSDILISWVFQNTWVILITRSNLIIESVNVEPMNFANHQEIFIRERVNALIPSIKIQMWILVIIEMVSSSNKFLEIISTKISQRYQFYYRIIFSKK